MANFIVKNSQAAPVLNTTAQYTDPFTGGSRYIPTSNAPSTEQKIPIASSSNSSVGTIYIPRDSYLKLEQANLTVIFGDYLSLFFIFQLIINFSINNNIINN